MSRRKCFLTKSRTKSSTLLDPLASVFQSDDERSAGAARTAGPERLVGQQALELAALKKVSTWRGGTPGNGGMS